MRSSPNEGPAHCLRIPMALTFLAKRVGFSRDAVAADDRSGCSPMQGWLSKRSSRGIYQRRFL